MMEDAIMSTKDLALWAILNLGSLICVAAAAVLCFYGKDGWGWFLFVAVCLHSSWDTSDDDCDCEDDKKSEEAKKSS